MPLDDSVRVQHILDAANEAAEFLDGRTREDVFHDRMLARALVNCVEVIGEAANQLSQEFRNAHTDIDWSAMIAMRHRLIHAYFDINYGILWSTVTEDVPQLVQRLSRGNES